MIKGLENYLTWYYRVSEGKEAVLLHETGIENYKKDVSEMIKKADIFVASCSSFNPTDSWKEYKDMLAKKKWYVIHKGCELRSEEDFRKSEVYSWLLNNKNVAHIDAKYVLNLNQKVNELKNKPRLDT
jgi:hypothetical protein